MPNCAVVLMYEASPKPLPLGWTRDGKIMVMVKRQLIAEAQETLKGAAVLRDEVLIMNYRQNLEKLQQTLDLLIPPELEELLG